MFYASFRINIRLHLKREARVLIICRRFTSLTRARGRCFETCGRSAGVSVPPSPNAAPIVEQRRESKQKRTRSVQKLFRSFLVSGPYQDTGGYQRSKLANWIYVQKCVIGTSLLTHAALGGGILPPSRIFSMAIAQKRQQISTRNF